MRSNKENIMTIRKNVLIFIMGLVCTMSVSASGTASFQSGKQKQSTQMEYLDANTVRINMPGQENSYLLSTEGKVYTVSYRDDRPIVMDMSELRGMMSDMDEDVMDNFNERLLHVKKTSSKRTVAGYTGDVYIITWEDSKGQHQDKVVLSSHPYVLEFRDAWMTFLEVMHYSTSGELFAEDSVAAFFQNQDKGVLAFGNEFQMTQLKRQKVDATRFKLPVQPMKMSNLFGVNSPNSKHKQSQASKSDNNIVTNEYERQKQRQINKVKNKSSRKVDKTIDKAVDKLLDKIF